MKRRFWPTIDFRAIHYLAPNRVELLALEANGEAIWLFESLTGALKPFWADSTANVTAITVLDDCQILLGTFDGRLIKLNEAGESQLIAQIDCPLLLIANEDAFVDSSGRLYWKSRVVLDDGVLQPCGLFLSKSAFSLFLIKHRTIYTFNILSESVSSVKLDSDGVFCAATLLNHRILLLATDSNHFYTFDHAEGYLKRINALESDSSDSESSNSDDSESETISESKTISLKSERIFSIITNQTQNDPIVLKVDSIHKRAWLESVKLTCEFVKTINQIPPITITFEKVPVICPLCPNSRPQTLPLNSSKCSKGHPLTICAIKKEIVSDLNVFRCRNCNAAYSCNPFTACIFCSSLLTIFSK